MTPGQKNTGPASTSAGCGGSGGNLSPGAVDSPVDTATEDGGENVETEGAGGDPGGEGLGLVLKDIFAEEEVEGRLN